MKKALFLLAFLLMISCVSNKEKSDNPVPGIIAGKILNYVPGEKELRIQINNPGLVSPDLRPQIDSTGCFKVSFESYIPTDAWVFYKTNFLIIVHPGDSIYLEFDGTSTNRAEALKSAVVGGDGARENSEAIAFQGIYYADPLYNDRETKNRAVRDLDADSYLLYLDTVRQQITQFHQQFVSEYAPMEETALWTKNLMDIEYFYAAGWYPFDHRMLNNLKEDEWDVPLGYYDVLLEALPLTKESLSSGYVVSGLVNMFHYMYAMKHLMEEPEVKALKGPDGSFDVPLDVIDSVMVCGLVAHTPDTLLRQLVLSDLFSQRFEKSDISLFERFRPLAEKVITEPFLIKPLIERYDKLKELIENPQVAPDAILIKPDSLSAGQVMDTILACGKGKVIYLDCWATWCGPCRSEMPRSETLMSQMAGKDVAFIYLCIDSEEQIWKAALAEMQTGGIHLWLTKDQSTAFRDKYDVHGIPHYFLIDKSGKIIEKGSHLRPGRVEDKLNELLSVGE